MIPTSFEYKKASSVEEAISLLNEDSKILAGGHSLIPAMKLRLNQPETLIDITKIPGLRSIKDGGDHIIIGANSTHHDIVHSDLIKSSAVILSQGGDQIGDRQIRNKGTLGGSIAHADPAADWPAMLIACDATIRVQGASGQRDISANDFFTGFFETALNDGEIITEVHVPKQGANVRGYYAKFPQPASRFAIVGCAAVVEFDGNRCKKVNVAYNGVIDHAYRDGAVQHGLEGREFNAENVASSANLAGEKEDILSDLYASERYRKHLTKVYTKRALMALDNRSDDLTKVEGVGPKIAELLNNAGIQNFGQLANTSVDAIKAILVAAGGMYASKNPGTWPAQAKMAANGQWDELKKWQDELDGGV